MIDDLDILRAANILVQRHCADAAIEAARRADEMLEVGDMEGTRSRSASFQPSPSSRAQRWPTVNGSTKGRTTDGERVN